MVIVNLSSKCQVAVFSGPRQISSTPTIIVIFLPLRTLHDSTSKKSWRWDLNADTNDWHDARENQMAINMLSFSPVSMQF
jgi:hypothetical protein